MDRAAVRLIDMSSRKFALFPAEIPANIVRKIADKALSMSMENYETKIEDK
jgi:hypothetical protein